MSVRDYGLPNSKVTGVPKAKMSDKDLPPCPNCGCNELMEVEVSVEQSLVGGPATSKYLGCPACPWASPAIVFSS